MPLRELGFIYKSLPFVSFQTLTLCSNPNEPDVEKLIPLSRNKLAELTNCNVDTVTDVVKKLEERHLLASMLDGRCNKYYISPKIVNRLADDSTTAEILKTNEITKFAKRMKENNTTNILDLLFGISNKKRD